MPGPYIHHYRGEDRDVFVQRFRDDPAALLRIDDEEAAHLQATITEFYRDHLTHAGMDGYVIGLSGGIDSTVTAHLLVDAVGAENVHGVIMPADHSNPADVDDAQRVAAELGITTNDPAAFRDRIDGIVDDLCGLAADGAADDRVRRGNVLARCRMIVLRDHAKARNALVAGTTNASERDLGYMTLAADGRGGVDNEALYNVYKTTERDLARHLDVRDRIIDKQPTADLWQGQRDEDELGMAYGTLDRILVGHRLGLSPEGIAAHVDASTAAVEDVVARVASTRFKRELAPHPSFA